ncbi:MAG TPA: FAD-dependent oxidoreductase [Thermoanaerobaculia bacterium]|jgi:glycine/D-amino acid oxidase-like deaminating enzyme/nitrite reductase/ring-hydroxylating ferredoxin subunit
MNRISLWEGTAADVHFPAQNEDLSVDVAIVGGGITGITAAQLLVAAGKSVAVIEAHRVGRGTTGHSTGNLHVAVDDQLQKLRKKWGDDVLSVVCQSRQAMITFIERTISQYGIDCGFVRRPHFIFPAEASQISTMEEEHAAALAGGLAATLSTVDLPMALGPALRIDGQAQFQPLSYVALLAKAIASDRCRIFENTKVVDINDRDQVVTTTGGGIRAKKIILATHTPKGFHLVQTELGPYREYGMAAKLASGALPDGIFWTLETPMHHSIRSYDGHLIVIGEKHKVGQHDNAEDYYGKLETYARRHFNVTTVDYRWSGQHYKPADELPFIGQSGTHPDLYMATGFSTSGLLYGPLAAHIITDDILGRENEWASVYKANRFTPVKSAKEFVKENVNVAEQYVKDFLLRRADVEKVADVAAGEGCLVEIDGKKVAVHRSTSGEWTALSPICTHMGCIVHWNGYEKSWDCPCHGSRFATDGEVIEGPAMLPLERLRVGE